MKKIAILGLMFFIIFSQIFADENLDKFENICFIWQLFSYYEDNSKIDFINLNPLFINNNIFKNNQLSINIYQNNNSQNNSSTQSYSQKNDWLGFLIYTGAVITGWSMMDRQQKNIYNDTMKQQEEMVKFYQRIYPKNRNY